MCSPARHAIPPRLRRIELAGVALAFDHEWIEINVTKLTLAVLIENAGALNAQLILELVDDVSLELMTLASG